MKHPAPAQARVAHGRPAAAPESTRRPGGMAQPVAQRMPADRLHGSPRMVAQRAQLQAAFGAALQRLAGPQDALQTKAPPADAQPLQFIRTTTHSVAADLMYDYNNGRTLMRDASWNPFNDFSNYINRVNARAGRDFNYGIFMAGVRNRIDDGRIPVDYEQLEDTALPTGQALINWLNSGHAEHMWVNDGGTMRVARRNAEKKPHPTLAGGDPDVSGAGLLSIPAARRVRIDDRSGHFRPDGVDDNSAQQLRDALHGTRYRLQVA